MDSTHVVVATLALIMMGSSVRAQHCADVRTFDFRNATIRIAAEDEGGRSGPSVFRLQGGTGFLSDDPGSSQSHDWSVNLVADRLVHPDPSMWVSVIVLDKDHLTGTGDWRYVMAFACKAGSLVRLFQYGSEGVRLKHLDGQTLQLYQALLAPNDARCCPSKHVVIVYKWNEQDHRYRRAASTPGQGAEWAPDEK